MQADLHRYVHVSVLTQPAESEFSSGEEDFTITQGAHVLQTKLIDRKEKKTGLVYSKMYSVKKIMSGFSQYFRVILKH